MDIENDFNIIKKENIKFIPQTSDEWKPAEEDTMDEITQKTNEFENEFLRPLMSEIEKMENRFEEIAKNYDSEKHDPELIIMQNKCIRVNEILDNENEDAETLVENIDMLMDSPEEFMDEDN